MNKVVSKDKTEIAFTKTGNGYPLIIVDGAFCSRLFGLSVEGLPLLSNDFTVIGYDRRGRNESSDNKLYAVEREIEDIDALIQMAGGSVYLFGYSSGAALGLLASAAGLHIEKLALYDPPYATAENPSNHADAKDVLLNMIANDQREEAITYFLGDLSGVPSFVLDGMRSAPFWKTAIAMAHTLPYDAAIMGDCAIPVEKAKRIKIPVFVGGGDKTGAESIRAITALAETFPNSTLKILEGQNHQVSMKILAPELKDFFFTN